MLRLAGPGEPILRGRLGTEDLGIGDLGMASSLTTDLGKRKNGMGELAVEDLGMGDMGMGDYEMWKSLQERVFHEETPKIKSTDSNDAFRTFSFY